MKTFLIILICVFSCVLFSQTETRIFIDLAGNNSSNVVFGKGFSTLKLGITSGVQLDFNSVSETIGISYQRENNFEFEKYGYVSPNFTYKSNFLGISNNLLFLSPKKRFRPLVKINILTEIKSNYKGGFLWDNDRGNLLTLENYNITPSSQKITTSPSPNNPAGHYYTSNFYHSTPFVGSLLVGCDIRLVKNLHLNLSLGYGLRVMKTQNTQWINGEDVSQKLKTSPIETHYFHMLDCQFGLNYTFSFKKKQKTEMP